MFVGVMSLSEIRILEKQLPPFLLSVLTYQDEIVHITFLTVLQIKFECRQFVSIFVGVMPLLELRILEIHSFPHFATGVACQQRTLSPPDT